MKKIVSIVAIALLVGGAAGAYYLFKPHRDIIASAADHQFNVEVLVDEYLANAKSANAKYLAADGGSKIIVLSGKVDRILQSADGRSIVILKEQDALAGFQCLFDPNADTSGLVIGKIVQIKGVLRAGPGYDEDLEMYENGYLEACSSIK